MMNLAEGNRVAFRSRGATWREICAVNLILDPERLRSTATTPSPTIPPESSGYIFMSPKLFEYFRPCCVL